MGAGELEKKWGSIRPMRIDPHSAARDASYLTVKYAT